MTHEHLLKWGKDAFQKEISLEHIENYLLKRGLRKDEALKLLHEITSFEHKVQEEAAAIKKRLLHVPLILMLALSAILLLYLFIIKAE